MQEFNLLKKIRTVFLAWLALGLFFFLYDNGISSVNEFYSRLTTPSAQRVIASDVLTNVDITLADGTVLKAKIISGRIQDGVLVGSTTLETEQGTFVINIGDETQPSQPTINPDTIVSTELKDGSVTEDKLADSSVTAVKIVDGTITGGKLVDGIIVTRHLADNAVTSVKLADGAVTSTKLLDGVILTDKLADGVVTEIKLADGSVVTGKLADYSVTGDKIANATITEINLADGSVATATVLDGAITSVKIEDGSITLSKLSDLMCSDDQILKKIASDWVCAEDIGTGSVTAGEGVTNSGTADDPILDANVDDVTIEIVADTIQLKDGGVTSGTIQNGTIINDDISALANIEWAKISKVGSSLADLETRNFTDLTGKLAQYVEIQDTTNYFTATDTEGAIQEIGANYFRLGGNSFGGTATFGTNDANSLALETGGTTRMTVASNGSFVGIGQAPANWSASYGALQVMNAAFWAQSGSNDTLITSNSHFNGSNYVANITGASTRLRLTTSGGLAIATAPSVSAGANQTYTDALTILNSGNVGIGVTDPSSKLTVGGNIVATNTTATSFRVIASDATSFSTLGAVTGGNQLNLNVYGSSAAGNYITGVPNANLSTIYAGSSGGLLINQSQAAPIIFATNNTEAMRIISGGNVGIGTTSASSNLHVRGYGGANQSVNFSDSTLLLESSATSGLSVGPVLRFGGQSGNATNPYSFGWIKGAKESTLANNYSGYLSFTTVTSAGGYDERMRITSTGNIGVGTTNIGEKLHVGAGNILLDNSYALNFRNTSATSVNVLRLDESDDIILGRTSAGTDNLVFFSGGNRVGQFETTGNIRLGGTLVGSTPALYIAGSTSNVGIGTVSPTSKLHISTTATSLSANGLSYFDWSPSSASTFAGDLFSINIGANGNATNLLTIKDSGSILFGISEAKVTSNLPVEFGAPGDVSMAYDLQFTNPTSSFIKSNSSLYLQAGEVFNSSDLTLRTFNSGSVVVDSTSLVLNGLLNCSSGIQTNAFGVTSCITSDASVKNNVATLTSSLDRLMQLRGVSYNWKDTANLGAQTEFGLIAQEVEAVIPELVFTMGTGIKGVKYQQLTGLMIEAIKEQQAQVSSLQNQINSLNATQDIQTYLANNIVPHITAKTIKVDEKLEVLGVTELKGNVKVNGNTAGKAKIKAGQKTVVVTFSAEYKNEPIVTITPKGIITKKFGVTNTTKNQFTIELDENADVDIEFNWIALDTVTDTPMSYPGY